ncbi:MAG: HNH endonuclease [Mycobacterium sp.]|nr:MAG: HNH endonuclease [Mycobacterium sp.]
MNRPCIACGALIGSGSRCDDCRLRAKPPKPTPRRKGRTATDWRWRQLSERLRRLSPFCEKCLAAADLTVDHVIPLAERPDLAHDELNCRVLCRPCNAARGDRCSDEERAQVLAAIEARKRRQRLSLG